MAAGVFGYLGYDMVRLMEELPASHPDPIGLPDAVLIRPTLIVVFDAVKDSITVVTPVRPDAGVTAKAALTRAEERLSAVVDALDRPLDKAAAGAEAGPLDVPAKSNTTPERISGDGGEGEGVHPRRRHLPGGAVAALRGAVRRCRRSRSTARCGGSIRRRFSTSSISAATRSPDRARKSWSACAATP